MEQLYVRKELFPLSEDGPTYLRATDDEVLAYAATLITKERYLVDPFVARFVDRVNQVLATKPTSGLERPLPDEETP